MDAAVNAISQPLETWLRGLPDAEGLHFWPPPARLYTVADLYHGLVPGHANSRRRTWDARVYDWTLGPDGKPRDLTAIQTVATRLHDAAMDRLIRDFVDHDHARTVGFMGGHGVERTEPAYERFARIARTLRWRGFKIVTGGGPGLMEAANFGAFMAPHDEAAFEAAMTTLRAAPNCGNGDAGQAEARKWAWTMAAVEVRETLLGSWSAPETPGGESLGVPTWYYGAEPPNLFASASAKYFMNSLREDGLVSIANGGLVFGKGEAGTVQEVFQNANYNYYRGADITATPMAFFGAEFWNPAVAGEGPKDPERKPVFPLVSALAAQADHPFSGELILSDDPDEIVSFLIAHNADRERCVRCADQRLASVNAVPRRRRD